jgi:hypothetical protein
MASSAREVFPWKQGALALCVAILQAIFLALVTRQSRFSAAEFTFAFILTYCIGLRSLANGGENGF